jgi:hypothetical protein
MAQKNEKSVPIFNDAVQIQVRNRVLNNQAEEISKNERLLENADADLTTIRRQVEIIEDSSLRKANHLFLLKTLLTFSGLLFIPLVLKSQGVIPEPYGTYSVYAIIAVFLIIVLYNMKSVWSRNNNRFTLRNFLTKVRKDEGLAIPKRTCLAKTRSVKTAEELELERKLKTLQSLELKFKRIKPGIEVVDSRTRSVEDRINQIKAEYRDVFGASTSDRAIEIALRNRMDQKGKQLISFGI